MSKDNDYKESSIAIQAQYSGHFWYIYRNQVILSTISKHFNGLNKNKQIIELRAGAGNVCGYLKQQGYQIDASDMYESALPALKNQADHAFKYDIVKDKILDKYKGQYDLVIMADLIEHLDDPVAALIKAGAFLRPAGKLLITVPALRLLWTRSDKDWGHKKRYERASLIQELNKAGYQVMEINYFMLVPAIIIFIMRRLGQLQESNDIANKEMARSINFNGLMGKLSQGERFLAKYIKLPFGSSLIVVARK
jgi:SAM-dependent methyltransferase